jgi:hypothetical protein
VPYNRGIVSFDDHIRAAIDGVLSEVRAPIDGAQHALGATIAAEARASTPCLSVTTVDVLVRHAGLVLEARTARSLTGASR